ncbi:MAG: hypothetical protein JWR26_4661 [Pedosphaera sp.]|nr:hypothetical protein [Pedosphaera sp.]
MALCRLDRRHQQSGGATIINSSWMGSQSRLGQWAPQCHLSFGLSASQQGTGRCLRTGPAAQSQGLRGTRGTIGEGLLRLVKVKRLDVAWALGGTGAMDMLDPWDQKDEKDQRLRLDHGQRLVWGAAIMGAFRGRITGCGLPTGLDITRLNTLNHAWSGLVTLNSGVFFWCFHTGVFAHGHYADCHHGACARPPGDGHWSGGWKKPGHAFVPLGIGLERLGQGFLGPICFSGFVCTRPPCGRVPLRNTKSCAGQGHYYGEVWGLLILLPHKRDREARAILRMPPHGAACRRLLPRFSTCFFWCLALAQGHYGQPSLSERRGGTSRLGPRRGALRKWALLFTKRGHRTNQTDMVTCAAMSVAPAFTSKERVIAAWLWKADYFLALAMRPRRM